MSETVASVMAEVYAAFDPSPSASLVLQAINRIHRTLCYEFPVELATVKIPLVVGTQEYAVTKDLAKIMSVVLEHSATNYDVLQATTLGTLYADQADWRSYEPGTPDTYYRVGGKIGVTPSPNEGTGVSYPQLSVEALVCTPLTASGTMPDGIPSTSVYVSGACSILAPTYGPSTAGLWANLYERDFQDVGRTLGGELARFHRTFSPSTSYMASQV